MYPFPPHCPHLATVPEDAVVVAGGADVLVLDAVAVGVVVGVVPVLSFLSTFVFASNIYVLTQFPKHLGWRCIPRPSSANSHPMAMQRPDQRIHSESTSTCLCNPR